MSPFSVFSATSFASSVPSKVVSVSSLSFEADDFLLLFFGGSLSFTGVTFAFSLILADLLGVSPEPQSNSDTAGPPGCALTYCSNCLLLVISSPVGAVKTISPFLGVPLFLGTNCTSTWTKSYEYGINKSNGNTGFLQLEHTQIQGNCHPAAVVIRNHKQSQCVTVMLYSDSRKRNLINNFMLKEA
ncbi:hypothetical protein NC653_015868 [Populus alba x Populus x berolinensis]|uniref:Uncharacterized protein n=1 Tax=Populus alba x Populus x berolinensis TaxID=444605 RepID=A0AAD6QLI6_9ROSI|nr:hypothetical protein NC653_015868 [Populus alba x Populus x berolinensis]